MKIDFKCYISERTRIEGLDNSNLNTNILFELYYSGFNDAEAENIDFRYRGYNLSRIIIRMCFWDSKKGMEYWNKIRKDLNCKLSDYNF
jgi:hypothetical protein